MVSVRCPERLETGALCAWLRALDAAVGRGEGVRAPLRAPPALLAAALSRGAAGLREAVVARLAVSAVSAGVSRLEVHLEHPTLIEALLESLSARPDRITHFALTVGPRAALGERLCRALRGMSALTSLTLTPAATDAHLSALASASPPLDYLDLAYCPSVTDGGMRALVGPREAPQTVKEAVRCGVPEGARRRPASTLRTLNLWGTGVTTRCCVILLAACPLLTALTCRWSGEALDLVVRGGRTEPLALSQLLVSETRLPPLDEVAALCPRLRSLVARRPTQALGVGRLLGAASSLTALTLVQFLPEPQDWLPTTPVPHLSYLHLSLLEPRPVHLAHLARNCPALEHLYLEGITPTLSHPNQAAPPTSLLQSLRLVTPPTTSHVIEPEVVVWALVWAADASNLDLGSCKDLTDEHLHQAIARGALSQVEDLRVSGAAQLTDGAIDQLLVSCPLLRRLALKMLPKERLAQLESLKLKIREQNLDLELITYGWKF